MTEVGLDIVVRQGFGLVILLALPIVAAAVVASAAAGMLAARVGVQDSTVTLVARALAVVLAVGLTLGSLGGETLAFTESLWGGIASVGTGAAP